MSFPPGHSGNPDGRPKVTLDDLPEGWVNDVIALYAKGGADIEVRAQVFGGMSHDLWTRLLADEPLFSETIGRGRILAESWWVEQGRTALHLDKFQTGPWSLNMSNRFGWTTNRTDNKHDHTIQATKEQRDAAVKAALDADS